MEIIKYFWSSSAHIIYPFIDEALLVRASAWCGLIFICGVLSRVSKAVALSNRTPEAGAAYRAAYDQWKRDKAADISTREPDVLRWDNPTLLTLNVRRIGYVVNSVTGWFLFLAFITLISGISRLFFYDQSKDTFTRTAKIFGGLIKDPYYLGAMVAAVVVGHVLARLAAFAIIRRYIEFGLTPWLNSRDSRVTVKSETRTGENSDVRTLALPERIEFNPTDYFQAVRDANAVFLGVNERGEPVGLARDVWVKSNVQVMGPPGTGKGVQAAVVMAQGLQNYDDAVIVFDPKNDEWAPHVLRSVAKKFILLDLRRGKPAQINLFRKITPDHLFELFVAGFSLGTKGTDADHYRLGDRKAAYALSQAISADGATIFELLERAKALPDELKRNATGFIAQLEELSHIEAIQAVDGVDIADFIANGGCLYIIGAMRDDPVIRLQKMLFVRVIQLIEARSSLAARRQVTIFLDEVKYLLSVPSVNALGTIRDKACNIILAHQSLGDFASVGADLDPDAVKTSIIDNTPLKWIYRAKSFDTALWVSEQTGEISVDVEQRTVTRDGAVEVAGSETRLSKERRYLIDTNTIQHLPTCCAVCIGAGLAHLAFANPIRAQKSEIPLTIAARAAVVSPVVAAAPVAEIAAPIAVSAVMDSDNEKPKIVTQIDNKKSGGSLEDLF